MNKPNNTLTYSSNLVPSRGDVVHVPQLSMLSHDGLGGLTVIDKLLKAGAHVVLEEYATTIYPDDPWASIKVAGPCMAMMVLRYNEDQKAKRDSRHHE